MKHCNRNKLTIEKIDPKVANDIVIENHYLHRGVYLAKNIAYGIKYDGKDGMGIAMFGYPIFRERRGLLGRDKPKRKCGNCERLKSRSHCVKCDMKTWVGHVTSSGFVCQGCKHDWVRHREPLSNGELVDLQRLWLPDDFPPGSESCAIGKTLRALPDDWKELTKKKARAVIAFADTEGGNTGVIYRAANFTKLGVVRGRRLNSGGKHGRWDKDKKGRGQQPGKGKIAFLRLLEPDLYMNWLKTTYASGGT